MRNTKKEKEEFVESNNIYVGVYVIIILLITFLFIKYIIPITTDENNNTGKFRVISGTYNGSATQQIGRQKRLKDLQEYFNVLAKKAQINEILKENKISLKRV
jgi:hypothetical protein